MRHTRTMRDATATDRMLDSGRGWRAARPPAALAALLLLSACGVGERVGTLYDRITGDATEGRPPPPGLAAAYPNLASVPARPERGAASTREALSSALAANRAQSGQPVQPDAPVPEPPATEGAALVPRAPPAPARLAAAPPIGNGPATLLLPGTAGAPAQSLPEIGSTPAPPPAEMLAPPPPDLSAPPPPVLR